VWRKEKRISIVRARCKKGGNVHGGKKNSGHIKRKKRVFIEERRRRSKGKKKRKNFTKGGLKKG